MHKNKNWMRRKSAFNCLMKGRVFLSFAILFTLLSAHSTSDRCYEYSKVIKKEVAISPGGQVFIDNKYGKIEVEAWDKNRVKVAVTIVVRAEGEYYAQRVFDRIEISFDNRSDYLSASTVISNPEKEWWLWGSNLQDDYTITYKVYMPENARLEVKNRHGDIHVSGIQGATKLSVEHGNIIAADLGKSAEIFIEDGYANIGQVGLLRVESYQARIRVEEAGDLIMNSRFSRVRLNKVDRIICHTKYDTYTLEKVGSFTNEGRYDDIEIMYADEIHMTSKLSDLFVKKVTKSLHLNIDSSNVQTVQLGPDFKQVELNGQFTDFRIGVSGENQYQVDAVTNYAGVRYPRNLIIAHEQDKGTHYELKGHVGAKSNPKVIRARIKYGSLRLEDD
jgi:hypothetical protein